MTIIHNTNTISTTIGEIHELLRVALIHYGDSPETIINIVIDGKGNGIVSTPTLDANED